MDVSAKSHFPLAAMCKRQVALSLKFSFSISSASAEPRWSTALPCSLLSLQPNLTSRPMCRRRTAMKCTMHVLHI